MAKTLKTIKCPTCGSTKITETRQDYYKCNSCGVDFLLDNDDITINLKHYPERPSVFTGFEKIKKWLIIGFVGIFVLLFLIKLLSPSRKTTPHYSTYSSSVANEEKKEEILFKWDSQSEDYVFLSKDNDPLVLIIGNIKKNNDHLSKEVDNTFYLGIYDLKTSTKKLVKVLEESNTKTNSPSVEIRKFEDGNIYTIINKRTIYQIKPDFTFQNIGEQYIKNNTDLTAGIAKITFENESYGSVLNLVTNEGKQLSYLPLINKTYKKDKLHNAISKTPPQAKILTAYTFSRLEDDFPDEKIYLVRYNYKHQNGYPKEDPIFGWVKDYLTYGTIYDNSPYVKRFIREYWREQAKITSYEIMTPESNYFSPKVLAFNDNQIMIRNKVTPIEEDPDQIQILNSKTGAIELTFQSEIYNYRKNNFILHDGYIIESGNYYYFDKNGKLINKFDLNDIKMNEIK